MVLNAVDIDWISMIIEAICFCSQFGRRISIHECTFSALVSRLTSIYFRFSFDKCRFFHRICMQHHLSAALCYWFLEFPMQTAHKLLCNDSHHISVYTFLSKTKALANNSRARTHRIIIHRNRFFLFFFLHQIVSSIYFPNGK